MSRQQNTVIWIGLILVTLNVIIHLADFKSLLFGGAATAAKTTANTPQGNTVQPVGTSGGMSTPQNVQAV